MTKVAALFPGTFDPFTNGHLDIVRRGTRLVDRLIVGVLSQSSRAMFTLEERIQLAEQVLTDAGLTAPAVEVVPFAGLVVDAARAVGATVLLRGVRGAADLDYEIRMAFANNDLAEEIETVFLPPSPDTMRVSGTLVREVATLGGDVSRWVHPAVVKALQARVAP